MNREVHVRNCEGVGVKLPRATRLRNMLIARLFELLLKTFQHHS